MHISSGTCSYVVTNTGPHSTGVALFTHITHVRSMRKTNIYNNVLLTKYFVSLPLGLLLKERICSHWEQILSFKSSLYFESYYRHNF